MPLRIVRRRGRQHFYIRGTVRGKSVFETTETGDRSLAEAYRIKRESELWRKAVHGEREVITFAFAAESYLLAEPRKREQIRLIGKLGTLFGDRKVADLGQLDLDAAYSKLLRPNPSPATKLRNVLTPLRAVLEHAARRGWCDRPAFEVPRQPRPRVAFLLPEQATALAEAAAPHLRPLIVFLIGTAARMSEALELDWAQVDLAAARVTFSRTKTDRERRVALAPAVRAALAALEHREGRVFRPARVRRNRRGEAGLHWQAGQAYRDTDRNGGGQIKTAWAAAWRRSGLPLPALRPHDLRHTAATWRYAIEPDLLRLRDFGGWSSVSQVEIYTHLLPEHYAAAAAAWLGLSGDLDISAGRPPRWFSELEHSVTAKAATAPNGSDPTSHRSRGAMRMSRAKA